MAVRRYRLPVGPRRSPETHRIVNRAGRYLLDASRIPFSWTDREPMALSFRSRAAARAFVRDRFVGEAAARELGGIRVVP